MIPRSEAVLSALVSTIPACLKLPLDGGSAGRAFPTPGTKEGTAGCLWVGIQSDLHSEFQARWDYIVRPYLKIQKQIYLLLFGSLCD